MPYHINSPDFNVPTSNHLKSTLLLKIIWFKQTFHLHITRFICNKSKHLIQTPFHQIIWFVLDFSLSHYLIVKKTKSPGPYAKPPNRQIQTSYHKVTLPNHLFEDYTTRSHDSYATLLFHLIQMQYHQTTELHYLDYIRHYSKPPDSIVRPLNHLMYM